MEGEIEGERREWAGEMEVREEEGSGDKGQEQKGGKGKRRKRREGKSSKNFKSKSHIKSLQKESNPVLSDSKTCISINSIAH